MHITSHKLGTRLAKAGTHPSLVEISSVCNGLVVHQSVLICKVEEIPGCCKAFVCIGLV